MILKAVLIFCIVYAVAGKHVKVRDLPESVPLLKWPDTRSYSVEATKYYMGSSLIENFKYWRNNSKRSRLEINDGAVIKIVRNAISTKVQYEIHPETTEEETNKMVCVKKKTYSVHNFLPYTENLSEQGTENVKGIDCIKFTNEDQSSKQTEKTLWAYYDNSITAWVPVRYITKDIDDWHGYLTNYEIWDYFNFKIGHDPSVYNVTYNCTTIKNSNKGPAEEKYDDIKTYGGLSSEKLEKANIPFPYSEMQVKEIAATLPTEYDLRLEGLVGPVIKRHNCGPGAFAVTAAVEGALARSNGGTWIKLSEQALIDCSWGYGNKGCTEVDAIKSYAWIMEHGLPTDQKYGAYTNQNGFCKMENMTKTYKIKGYTSVTPFSVEALKIALINHGPVVVKVDSMLAYFYDGGVFFEPYCKTSPENGYYMALVGYGEKDGDTFWILKPSEGPYSGIDGYIHVSARDNNCGVMTEPTYVVA